MFDEFKDQIRVTNVWVVFGIIMNLVTLKTIMNISTKTIISILLKSIVVQIVLALITVVALLALSVIARNDW